MRVVVTVLLMLATAPAWAEWVKLAENNAAITYVDLAELRIDGTVRRVSVLADLKWPRGDRASSIKTLVDYDCKLKRSRTLFVTSYSGPMATGKAIDSGPTRGEWQYAASVMSDGAALDFICAQ